jgi:hypothetical protein
VATSVGAMHAASCNPEPATSVVTYEAFGAVGDGVTDDLPETAWFWSRTRTRCTSSAAV